MSDIKEYTFNNQLSFLTGNEMPATNLLGGENAAPEFTKPYTFGSPNSSEQSDNNLTSWFRPSDAGDAIDTFFSKFLLKPSLEAIERLSEKASSSPWLKAVKKVGFRAVPLLGAIPSYFATEKMYKASQQAVTPEARLLAKIGMGINAFDVGSSIAEPITGFAGIPVAVDLALGMTGVGIEQLVFQLEQQAAENGAIDAGSNDIAHHILGLGAMSGAIDPEHLISELGPEKANIIFDTVGDRFGNSNGMSLSQGAVLMSELLESINAKDE